MTTASVLRGTTFDSRAFAPYVKTAIPNQSTNAGASVSLNAAFYIAAGTNSTWSATGLPTGVSISTTTGLVSGTATGASTSAQITCTNSLGSVNSSFAWTMQAAAFVVADVAFIKNSISQSVDLLAAWTPPAGESYSSIALVAGTLPPGVTLNSSTHLLTYDGVTGTPPITATGLVVTVTSVAVAASLTSFQLTSATGGTLLPFTIGQPFKQGDIPTGQFITSDLATFQADVRNRWADGSVKFAVLSGRKTFTGTTTVQVNKTSSAPTGTTIAESSLNALAPITVGLAGFGTVSLSALLGSPVRSILGVQMSEFHYRSPVGADPHLVVWFFVRSYLGGQVEIETCVENGYIGVAGGADKSYTATVTINGTVRYTAALVHWPRSRWFTVNWYDGTNGTTDFARVTPAHDVAYFKATKLVPNFSAVVSAAETATYSQNIVPLGQAQLPTAMGHAGYGSHLGPMSEWDAAYISSGDVKAYRGAIVNSYAMATWHMGYRDENTNVPLRLTIYPGLNIEGWTGTGFTAPAAVTSANPHPANIHSDGWHSHQPSSGYLAYLLTGRWTHLEICVFQATQSHICLNPAARGTNWPKNSNDATKGGLATDPADVQDRAKAYHIRSLMMATSIYPDPGHAGLTTAEANVRTDFINALNATFPKMVTAGDKACPLGYIARMQSPGLYGQGGAYPAGTVLYAGGWQQCIVSICFAMAADIDSFLSTAGRAALLDLRDHFNKYVVGLLGDGSGWNYRWYNTYKQAIGTYSGNISNPGTPVFHPDWGTAFSAAVAANVAIPDIECPVTVQSAAEGLIVLGNDNPFDNQNTQTIFPISAIAYAVDNGAVDATNSYRRLTTCAQWNQYITTDAKAVPQWAVLPRNPAGVTSYSTPFTATEPVISEGGKWVNGLADGGSWNNVQTTGGRAFGTAFSGGPPYSDNIAHLATSYLAATPAQYAEATVYKVGGYTNPEHEIELLLRFSIVNGAARGYEILWDVDGNCRIVKWLGPLNSYTYTLTGGNFGPFQIGVPVSGDVLRAEISASNVFTIKKNGAVVGVSTSDTAWPTGQPGLGIWAKTGATLTSYGWEDWSGGNL